jgi:hypothetical protein
MKLAKCTDRFAGLILALITILPASAAPYQTSPDSKEEA